MLPLPRNDKTANGTSLMLGRRCMVVDGGLSGAESPLGTISRASMPSCRGMTR